MAKKKEEDGTLSNLLSEKRRFEPSADFAERARLKEVELDLLRAEAAKDFETYWARLAKKTLTWDTPFQTTLKRKHPFVEWFGGGKLNASAQCLDRHVAGKSGDRTALVWIGEPSDANGAETERRTYTYRALLDETARFAQGLRDLGVKKGDRVAIYLPMIPEAAVALLACARIGATHTVIFGGFSAEALRDRITDAQASLVITASGGFRRGKIIPLKGNVDAAVAQCPSVKKVVVVDRLGESGGGPYPKNKPAGTGPTPWTEGRDVWYHDAVSSSHAAPESVDSEHPLFILYTSGTTGKPKGVVHSTAGYMLWAQLTCEWVFDLNEKDKYWCTADIGWVTGHSYVIYGPLAAGATTLMYEGAPDTPTFARLWKIVEREKVTVFYTAPTAIRAFMRQGEEFPRSCDMSSLRLLGSVGEPINPEAWMWYQRNIGHERCPIVDTWWQTETGGIMISPVPGVTATKPGSATKPLPGVFAEVVDDKGHPVPPGHGGKLVITKPWPSQLRTVYGDPDRYVQQYYSTFPEYYFTGDGAHKDKEGYFWIMGRIDDVINVAGHRLGTMEIESAIVSHPHVAEAAVVGRPDDLKGTAICAFVTPKKEFKGKVNATEIKAHVVKEIGALARPDDIRFTDALPKTRSGKIMRRLLRDIAAGKDTVGDTTTLEDLSVLSSLRAYQDEG
jgi:acetyl-CoA synthetase